MAANTKEKIEAQALLLFSRQGLHETSIQEIAQSAGVSEATIFRLYSTKQALYRETVLHHSALDGIDLMPLRLSLTMEDLRLDLMTIARTYFKLYFARIHPLRIFVSGLVQVRDLREFGYLLMPPLVRFLEDYLTEMEARRLVRIPDPELAKELFHALIFKDVTFLTTFEKHEEWSEALDQWFETEYPARIDLFAGLILTDCGND